jgi:hypothetical protein
MSTAATETSTESTSRRSPASRQRTLQDASRRELTQVREHTEAAVSDLVSATTDALRAFVPAAALRPTEAVDYTFDVAEQVLAGLRRVFVEIAGVIESGLQGTERRAA